MAFAIKVEISDQKAKDFDFPRQKTMYGGKQIAEGDTVFLFASENEGGQGLIAQGVVMSAKAVPRKPGIERQTPRVSIAVKRTALAKRPLGRRELKPFADWKDGRPETELNFKFYRQATNKIVGLSDETTAFLQSYF
jgi:hypothetical protein